MMVPKSWAALSDALDEGCAHATSKAIEALEDRALIRDDIPSDTRAAVQEAIRTEVLNAICERFHFDDPEEA